MFLASFAEDPEKQGGGAPIYIESSHGTITFYVKRIGTEESNKALKNIRKALFGPFHNSSDGDANELYAHWLAEYGVTGWDNLVNDDTGEQVKYSIDAARTLFLNESYYHSLNTMLITQAA